MVGVRMPDAAHALSLTQRLLARGYLALTGGIRGDVVTLTPALTIDESLLLEAGAVLASEATRVS